MASYANGERCRECGDRIYITPLESRRLCKKCGEYKCKEQCY